MEYQKPPSATAAFSTNVCHGRSHSHSLSFSGNLFYDGVFLPPSKNKQSPSPTPPSAAMVVDYGEIFLGSGTSIPFLDVPELMNERKVKVDVRSSNVDYSQVFGGFKEEFDFPDEMIAGLKKRTASSSCSGERDLKKSEMLHGVSRSCPVKSQVSSPEAPNPSADSMKQFKMSYHQTDSQSENGTTHIAQLHAVSGYTGIVDNVSHLPKAESKTSVSSNGSMPCRGGFLEDKLTKNVRTDLPQGDAASKQSSKTDAAVQNISNQNGCNASDKLFDSYAVNHDTDHPKVLLPPSVNNNLCNRKGAPKKSMGTSQGVSKSCTSEDTQTPCSPPYFGEDKDANSAAAASAAAVKKAIEEAELRIKLAKEILGRKKDSFFSRGKPNFSDGLKAEEKSHVKVGGKVNKLREKEVQDSSEEVHTSGQLFPKVGDQHERKARKLWELPGGFSKSILDHEQEEVEKCEAAKIGNEHPRKARKHWEVPGGFTISALDPKQEIQEKPQAEKHGNNLKVMQAVDICRWEEKNIAGNTYYKLEEQSNKIRSAEEAFRERVVEWKNDAVEGECSLKESSSNLRLADEVLYEESKKQTRVTPFLEQNKEKFLVPPEAEMCERKLEEIQKPTGSKRQSEMHEHVEPEGMLIQECLQEKDMGRLEQEVPVGASENAFQKEEIVMRLTDTPDEVCDHEMVKFREELNEACQLAEDREKEKFLVPPEAEMYETKLEEIQKPTGSKRQSEMHEYVEPEGMPIQECLKTEKEVGRIEQEVPVGASENALQKEEIVMRLADTPGLKEFAKSSDEVYDHKMVKFREELYEACQLAEDREKQEGKCLGGDCEERSDEVQEQEMVHTRINNTSNNKETYNRTELSGDLVYENWNMLKQMFKQMFQTTDIKTPNETSGVVESVSMCTEIDGNAEARNSEGAKETPDHYGTSEGKSNDVNQEDKTETDSSELEGCTDDRENEDMKLALEVFEHEDHGMMDGAKESLVYKLTGEEPEAVKLTSNQEEKELSGTAGLAHDGASELGKTKEPDDSNSSHVGLLFESKQGDWDVEEVQLEQNQCDQCAEETSTAFNVGQDGEELSCESKESGPDVEEIDLTRGQEEDENCFESSSEESSAGYEKNSDVSESPCKFEKDEETIYAADAMETSQTIWASDEMQTSQTVEAGDAVKTSQRMECNEDKPREENNFESSPEETGFHRRKNSEAADSLGMSGSNDKMEEAGDKNSTENIGENQYKSQAEEDSKVKHTSQRELQPEEEHLKKIDEAKEREKEREKERIMVERAIREARERAFSEARERAERAATEKANAEARRRAMAEARAKSQKISVEGNDKSTADRASMEAKIRAERAAVERALAEARERALEKALSGKARSQSDKSFGSSRDNGKQGFSSSDLQNKGSAPSKSSGHSNSSNQSVLSGERHDRANGEPAERCKARSERHQRTAERAAKALAEKKMRDVIAQKEQAARNRLAETLDAEVKRWSSGKESNLRALLSTLQYILGPDSGWKPIPLTDLVSPAAVRKAYRRATLYVHPDKLQQRGAGIRQKYTCEKVFDLLKEAWNRFGTEER